MTPNYTITPLDIWALGDFPHGDLILAPGLTVRVVKDDGERELVVVEKTTPESKK
jgi:hypothetical protein